MVGGHSLRSNDWSVPVREVVELAGCMEKEGGVAIMPTGPDNNIEEVLWNLQQVQEVKAPVAVVSLRMAKGVENASCR